MSAVVQIQIRKDTKANWFLANPILKIGEPAFETDTKLQKIGDGVTVYSLLGYVLADNYYEFGFISAVSVSILGSQHNFNRVPQITIYNSIGEKVFAQTNINFINFDVTINFNKIQTGKIILT